MQWCVYNNKEVKILNNARRKKWQDKKLEWDIQFIVSSVHDTNLYHSLSRWWHKKTWRNYNNCVRTIELDVSYRNKCMFICTIHGNHIISIRTKPRNIQFVIIVHQHVDVAMLRIYNNERELKRIRPMQMTNE